MHLSIEEQWRNVKSELEKTEQDYHYIQAEIDKVSREQVKLSKQQVELSRKRETLSQKLKKAQQILAVLEEKKEEEKHKARQAQLSSRSSVLPGFGLSIARSVPPSKPNMQSEARRNAQDGGFEIVDAIEATPLSLDDINDHCILEIFKCLSVEDLNSIAVFISARYRDLRNHDSLDQTRTGVIVCTENTTLESIHAAFVTQGWNRVFTGNRTRLKVVGLERMPRRLPRHARLAYAELLDPQYLLQNVSTLDLSFDPLAVNRTIAEYWNVLNFTSMLRNLKQVDFSYMTLQARDGHEANLFSTMSCRGRLQRIIWNGSRGEIYLDEAGWKPFAELYLDDSRLISFYNDDTTHSVFSGPGEDYMFSRCPDLERLSIKNVTWSSRTLPLSQEMLIKMVRRHDTLRWLRSDLTEENIAMLKHECPEITFVSD